MAWVRTSRSASLAAAVRSSSRAESRRCKAQSAWARAVGEPPRKAVRSGSTASSPDPVGELVARPHANAQDRVIERRDQPLDVRGPEIGRWAQAPACRAPSPL